MDDDRTPALENAYYVTCMRQNRNAGILQRYGGLPLVSASVVCKSRIPHPIMRDWHIACYTVLWSRGNVYKFKAAEP